MKTMKRYFAFFLAVIAVLTFSTHVWAAEPESPIAAEHGNEAFEPESSIAAEQGDEAFEPESSIAAEQGDEAFESESSIVVEQGDETFESESSTTAEHGIDSLAISPRVYCTKCYVGELLTVCEGQRYWDNVYSHDKNGKTCLVNSFRAGGHYLCTSCGATRALDYADEYGGEHICVVNHSSCGLGDIKRCPLDYSPPPEPFH